MSGRCECGRDRDFTISGRCECGRDRDFTMDRKGEDCEEKFDLLTITRWEYVSIISLACIVALILGAVS